MQITRTLKPITIDLTPEEKEFIYREKHNEYLMMDAEIHCNEYLKNHNINLSKPLTTADYQILAKQFDGKHDCNIADNDQWETIVEEYINKLQ